MVRKWGYFLWGLGFFFSFVFFSYLVHKDLLIQFDFDTTVRLQDKLPRRVDEVFSWFSVLGSFDVSVVLLFILAGILFFFRKRLGAVLSIFSFGVFSVLELFGKIFVDHPGPPILFARYHQLVTFPSYYIPHPGFSYPSGHSGRTVFLSLIVVLFIFRSKRLTLFSKLLLVSVFAVYDVIMLVSRVYLGEHWVSDVIGGALLGVGLGLMTFQFMQGRFSRISS